MFISNNPFSIMTIISHELDYLIILITLYSFAPYPSMHSRFGVDDGNGHRRSDGLMQDTSAYRSRRCSTPFSRHKKKKKRKKKEKEKLHVEVPFQM